MPTLPPPQPPPSRSATAADDDGEFLILSLDGGGVHGRLSSLFMLYVERGIQLVRPDFSFRDAFHMYAGTSAGGIMVAGLGCSGYSVTDIHNRFCVHALRRIFDPSVLDRCVDRIQPWPKYASGPKTEELRRMIGDRVRFGPTPDHKIVLVPVYDVVARRNCLFTNTAQTPGEEPPAYVVADATSAAPTYFGAIPLRGRCGKLRHCCAYDHDPSDDRACGEPTPWVNSTFIDGGVSLNNPSAAAAVVAMNHLRGHSPQGSHHDDDDSTTPTSTAPPIQPRRIRLFSIGTGHRATPLDPKATLDYGLVQWLGHDLIGILQDETVTHELCELMLPCDDYVRINSSLLGTGVTDAIDDVSDDNLRAMERLARIWWRRRCRDVFRFFRVPFVPEAEDIELPSSSSSSGCCGGN